MLIARHSPATGYELSVYASLPPAVWGCLVVSMAGGIESFDFYIVFKSDNLIISQSLAHTFGTGLLAHQGCTGRSFAQLAQAGYVVGVHMGIDGLHQFEIKLFDQAKILLNAF